MEEQDMSNSQLRQDAFDLFESGVAVKEVAEQLGITYANAHYYSRAFAKANGTAKPVSKRAIKARRNDSLSFELEQGDRILHETTDSDSSFDFPQHIYVVRGPKMVAFISGANRQLVVPDVPLRFTERARTFDTLTHEEFENARSSAS